jgi:hypothetical protein
MQREGDQSRGLLALKNSEIITVNLKGTMSKSTTEDSEQSFCEVPYNRGATKINLRLSREIAFSSP